MPAAAEFLAATWKGVWLIEILLVVLRMTVAVTRSTATAARTVISPVNHKCEFTLYVTAAHSLKSMYPASGFKGTQV